MRLKDKIALVTGGAAGIGYATVERFLEEGATVAFFDVGAERVQQAEASLKAIGPVSGYEADVTDRAKIKAVVAEVIAQLGRIDILINNAGITRDAQFYKMTEEQFDEVVADNLTGVFNVSKAVVPCMMEHQYGRIVNASSVAGFSGNFGQSNYAATKAGLVGMSRVMARELAKYGITVNVVAPGGTDTDMFAAVPDEIIAKLTAPMPMKRLATPREIANVYLFLASEEASYVSGETIFVDGANRK